MSTAWEQTGRAGGPRCPQAQVGRQQRRPRGWLPAQISDVWPHSERTEMPAGGSR